MLYNLSDIYYNISGTYMSMIYIRYSATRYVCYNHPISIIYVSGILQKYYTYHLPDMCEYYCYSIHISDYIQSYRISDRYLITSILTCVFSFCHQFLSDIPNYHILIIYHTKIKNCANNYII